ncbi:MAG: hypothetical protein Q8M98_04170 [Candidatus Cloacimonadaceae bacterium]|nr:hypothetical protein [Candidatus Cloacimonadaceae bacterium]MDP3113954.1 hypothetical protein [Candidatus Cloacimonadaceae bacterium]
MRCHTAKRQIDLQAKTGLEPAQSGELRLHLESCFRCRVYFEQAQKLQRLLSPSSPPEFPTWLHENIMHQVRMHEPQRVILRRRMKLQNIPATLAIILSIYIGSLLGVNAFKAETPPVAEVSVYQDDSFEVASFGESTIFELRNGNGAERE